jgi:type IV pilus assembly protein PilA
MPPGPSVAPSSGVSGWLVALIIGIAGFFGIAILAAIAIPTFLGARERAQDREAQSSARNAYVAAQVVFTDDETYEGVTPELLVQIEPGLTYTRGGSVGPTDVSIDVVDSNFVVAVRSLSGTCFVLITRPLGEGEPSQGHMLEGTSCTAADVQSTFVPSPW